MSRDHTHDERAESAQALYSVGEVAKRTGISSHALRVWERRYDYPRPVRLASGHRRYTMAQIHHLRRVAEGVARGLRPGRLLRAASAELDEILAEVEPGAQYDSGPEFEEWLEHVRHLDAQALTQALREEALRASPLGFLEQTISPLLREVGRRWADGRLEVRHEHLCAHVVEDALRELLHRLERDANLHRGTMTLATLAGERHGLGLLMAAIVAATRGVRSLILGIETPFDQLVASVAECPTNIVGVSISLSSAGIETDRAITDLRQALPGKVRLVIGGDGVGRVRRRRPDVDYVATLEEFDGWFAREMTRVREPG